MMSPIRSSIDSTPKMRAIATPATAPRPTPTNSEPVQTVPAIEKKTPPSNVPSTPTKSTPAREQINAPSAARQSGPALCMSANQNDSVVKGSSIRP